MIKIIAILALYLSCLTIGAVNNNKGLSCSQARKATQEIVAAWHKAEKARLAYIIADQAVRYDSLTMPIHWQTFGEKPADGRSLYISLHGGGNVPKDINDSQWRNQWRLYTPHEGVYLCPRAPYNDWDMHCKPLTDGCYRDLINFCVDYMDVNPDKVYIMGYSAGGDGVWRLAPRMADTWAAASMMAGHPGDVSMVNLRNTPFMIWCGELDSAYHRNVLDAQHIATLDSLQRQDPGGYIHYGQIVKGKPHWMDRVDTMAVEWMAKYRRNPYPQKVVWRQEEVCKPAFYWLRIDSAQIKRGKEVVVSYSGDNTINIERCDYPTLTICLNDTMMDLDRPVTIVYQGRTLFKGLVKRTRGNIESNLRLRCDERYAFPAEVTVKL